MPKRQKLSTALKKGFLIGGGITLALTILITIFNNLLIGIAAMNIGIFVCGFEGHGGLLARCNFPPGFFFLLAFLYYALYGAMIGLMINGMVWIIKELLWRVDSIIINNKLIKQTSIKLVNISLLFVLGMVFVFYLYSSAEFYFPDEKAAKIIPPAMNIQTVDKKINLEDYNIDPCSYDPRRASIIRVARVHADYDLWEANVSRATNFHVTNKGDILYTGTYKTALCYAEGYAVVEDFQGDWFHIDMQGNRIYRENYDWVGDYKDGKARARTKDGHWITIDVNGRNTAWISFNWNIFRSDEAKILNNNQYKWVGQAIENRVRVRDQNDNWYHVDPNNTRIYTENYAWVSDFSQGRAMAEDQQGNWLYILPDGKQLNGTTYAYITLFKNGVAIVQDQNGKMFHIGLDGIPLYNEKYMSVDGFEGNQARVRDSTGTWFFINHKGDRVAEYQD